MRDDAEYQKILEKIAFVWQEGKSWTELNILIEETYNLGFCDALTEAKKIYKD